MDEAEQAQYQTIHIRKQTESKRDYNARLFAEYHHMDLGVFFSRYYINYPC